MVHLGDDGAAHLHRVVLLGFGAKIGHMVGRVVDAPDEAEFAIHHHDLAVHAAQHVQALAHDALAGVENAKVNAGFHQCTQVLVRQVGRAKAIHQHMHLHPALCRSEQRGMQFLADLVVEQDEGFEHHLAACLANGIEHPGEEVLPVLEQLELVSRNPARGL
ncbi:hypothetical protein D3C72_1931670 [compost metagenome]